VAIMARFDGLGYICFLQCINLNMDDKCILICLCSDGRMAGAAAFMSIFSF
jgi:hypothetical protein